MNSQRFGYVRISPLDPTPDEQLAGQQLTQCFSDRADNLEDPRPQLETLLEQVRRGDTLVVQSMSRLARSLGELRQLIIQLTARGVSIEFLDENLTFRGDHSPMAELLLSAMEAFAEFERARTRERQREGILLARERGVYRGRKKALSAAQIQDLQRRVDAGEPKAALAREFGISRATLYGYLRESVD